MTFVYRLLAITRNERKIFHIIEILLNEMRKSLTVIATDKSSCKKVQGVFQTLEKELQHRKIS